jgi:hypothetical protein
MTIIEAIHKIDDLMHNTYSQEDKVKWLSRLDSMVKRLVIDTHEGGESVRFTGYDNSTDKETVLLMPEPYDEAYLLYLETQICYTNGEYGKYNNAMERFNAVWQNYQNFYRRAHMPKGKPMKFF